MKAEDWLKSKGEEYKCSKCGRKSTANLLYQVCGMVQPDGNLCEGLFLYNKREKRNLLKDRFWEVTFNQRGHLLDVFINSEFLHTYDQDKKEVVKSEPKTTMTTEEKFIKIITEVWDCEPSEIFNAIIDEPYKEQVLEAMKKAYELGKNEYK